MGIGNRWFCSWADPTVRKLITPHGDRELCHPSITILPTTISLPLMGIGNAEATIVYVFIDNSLPLMGIGNLKFGSSTVAPSISLPLMGIGNLRADRQDR